MNGQNRKRSHGGSESFSHKGKLIGKADDDIPALSGNTAGSGTVSIWRFVRPSSGLMEDTGENVTAYNLSGAAVISGVFLQLHPEQMSGRWLVDYEDCETA